MANLTASISNSIISLGISPSTKWGTGSPYSMTWGVAKWGEGTEDLAVAVEKFLAESFTLSDVITQSLERAITLSESIGSTMALTSATLQSGTYYYVFAGPTIDAETRSSQAYTTASVTASTYTTVAAGSTTWS